MKKLYCSRDSVSGTWQDPQVFSCDSDAKRSFCWALASANVPEAFLKDVDLYCVGTFDETNGCVGSCDPVHVINGCNDQVKSYRETIDYYNHTFTEVNSNEISKEKA